MKGHSKIANSSNDNRAAECAVAYLTVIPKVAVTRLEYLAKPLNRELAAYDSILRKPRSESAAVERANNLTGQAVIFPVCSELQCDLSLVCLAPLKSVISPLPIRCQHLRLMRST